ncbi:MAG: hypothetical protein H6828_06915 [Planctomycetes bacterium]|nr:hypothetical protein [Planctomycetota bacterium]
MSEPNAAPKPLTKPSIWDVYYPSKIDENLESVPVASFPMIIYFWPSIFVFLACGVLQAMGVAQNPLGWMATASLAFNLLVIVTDLSQKKFVIAMLALVVVGLLLYIAHQKDMSFVGGIGHWIAGLELYYSTHVYFVISGFLFFFLFLGMLQPRVDYWLFEPNEFTHYVQPWGRDQSIPRQGSTVTREVPDVLELFLTFGGGSLVVRRENEVVARIEHVPFLGRRMKALENMLGVTRVHSV